MSEKIVKLEQEIKLLLDNFTKETGLRVDVEIKKQYFCDNIMHYQPFVKAYVG
jgi:hypothetical protein